MYAQLGTIVFQNLLAPTEYGRSSAAIYAEHPLVDGKARLQKTGDALDQISLAVRFHVSFCDNPKANLDELLTAMRSGDILTLVYGNGDIAGDFCIIQIDDFDEWSDPLGNRLSILANITLKECPTPNKLQQQQQDRIKNADSVGDKKPVVKKKANSSTCSKIVTDLVSTVENSASAIDKIVTVGGGIFIPTNRYAILNHIADGKAAAQDILTRCDDPASCASGKADLKYRAEQVIIAAANFTAVVTNNQYDQISPQNLIFKACARNLKAAAQALVNSSMLRKDG